MIAFTDTIKENARELLANDRHLANIYTILKQECDWRFAFNSHSIYNCSTVNRNVTLEEVFRYRDVMVQNETAPITKYDMKALRK